MSVVALLQNFGLLHCCSCGVAFAIPEQLEKRLRETHRHFYCPNGHEQWFSQETEAEKYKRLYEREQRAVYDATSRLLQEQAAKAKLEKRIAAGVCPCCNRTFTNLQRHMASKHKGYQKTIESPAPKQLQ